MRRPSSAVLCLALASIEAVLSFTPNIPALRPRTLLWQDQAPDGGPDDVSASSKLKRDEEIRMEEVALKGAEKIASMDISERTKRAMLAEVTENRIFELSEELEALFDGDRLPEANREKAVQIAKQTKSLRLQYEELVSGGPSSLLQSLEAPKIPEEDR